MSEPSEPTTETTPLTIDRAGGRGLRPGSGRAKVLFVDCDGLRLDKLVEASTPHLDQLRASGTFGPSYIQDSALAGTSSGPGHSNLLCGVWPDKHRVLGNDFLDHDLATYPDLFTLLRRTRPETSIFSTLDWAPLNDFLLGDADVRLQQYGPDAATTDRQSTDAAVEALGVDDPDLTFVYLHDADWSGHAHGSESAAYIEAIERVDACIGRLVEAVRARPSYDEEDWLILASTDHGQFGRGHGADQHVVRTIWVLASGPGIPVDPDSAREWRQVDLVPTVLRHLDVAIDPAWGLDGVAIGTPSDDPFAAVPLDRKPVEGFARADHCGGWTHELPEAWAVDDDSEGFEEFRGWRLMSGEFWATADGDTDIPRWFGSGRGSFVRSRGPIAVADPGAGGSAAFDSTLWSPFGLVDGDRAEASFVHHHRRFSGDGHHVAEVLLEREGSAPEVVWSAPTRESFEISTPVTLTVTTAGAPRVRIGFRLVTDGPTGYWAIASPAVTTS
ncbi:hypothetical protein GCM10009809_22980 [Isoptericola hypogeus]|uniref:Type I phosphodiesterase / nucleotide pyrophosphatase n=1 Tax=Isoptericola hypogeus TaxID=300179 RepID=A0ABP4VLI8_9MICO